MAEVIKQLGGATYLFALATCLGLFLVAILYAMFKSIRNQTAKNNPKKKRSARKAKPADTPTDQPGAESAPAVVPAAAIAKPRRFANSVAAAAQSTFADARPSNPPGSGGESLSALKKDAETQEQAGNRVGAAVAICKVGLVYQKRGDAAKARAAFMNSLAIFRDLASVNPLEGSAAAAAIHESRPAPDLSIRAHQGVGLVLMMLGWLQFDENWRESEAQFRLALEVFEKIPYQAGVAKASDALGYVHHLAGDLTGAENHHRSALRTFESLGDQSAVALSHALIGNVVLTMNQPEDATELLRKSVDLFEAQGLGSSTADVRAALADGLRQLGDVEGARREWTLARDLYVAHDNPEMVEEIDFILASDMRAEPPGGALQAG
ncbi:MAG: tetratricopeptide repeat protein [Methyloligellaceae bacterium]